MAVANNMYTCMYVHLSFSVANVRRAIHLTSRYTSADISIETTLYDMRVAVGHVK